MIFAFAAGAAAVAATAEITTAASQLGLQTVHVLLGNLDLAVHQLLAQPRRHDFPADIIAELGEIGAILLDHLPQLR